MGTIDNIISPKRVLFLSLITWGLYDFFWFYKNWKLIKQKENSNIHPYARSFLAVFYCHPFFKKVMETANNYGYASKYSSKNLAQAYSVLTIIGVVLGKSISGFGWWALLFSVIGLLAAVPLYEIQKAINFNNEHESGVVNLEKPFTFGEIALVVFGLVYSVFIIASPYFSQAMVNYSDLNLNY